MISDPGQLTDVSEKEPGDHTTIEIVGGQVETDVFLKIVLLTDQTIYADSR